MEERVYAPALRREPEAAGGPPGKLRVAKVWGGDECEGRRDWRAGQGRTGKWEDTAYQGKDWSQVQVEKASSRHGGGPISRRPEGWLEAACVIRVKKR